VTVVGGADLIGRLLGAVLEKLGIEEAGARTSLNFRVLT
jgi:hypothetical protein